MWNSSFSAYTIRNLCFSIKASVDAQGNDWFIRLICPWTAQLIGRWNLNENFNVKIHLSLLILFHLKILFILSVHIRPSKASGVIFVHCLMWRKLTQIISLDTWHQLNAYLEKNKINWNWNIWISLFMIYFELECAHCSIHYSRNLINIIEVVTFIQ